MWIVKQKIEIKWNLLFNSDTFDRVVTEAFNLSDFLADLPLLPKELPA